MNCGIPVPDLNLIVNQGLQCVNPDVLAYFYKWAAQDSSSARVSQVYEPAVGIYLQVQPETTSKGNESGVPSSGVTKRAWLSPAYGNVVSAGTGVSEDLFSINGEFYRVVSFEDDFGTGWKALTMKRDDSITGVGSVA